MITWAFSHPELAIPALVAALVGVIIVGAFYREEQ